MILVQSNRARGDAKRGPSTLPNNTGTCSKIGTVSSTTCESLSHAQYAQRFRFGRGSTEAEGMLEATWAGRRLRGHRNLPAADREAVIDTILRIGRLAADVEEIQEIEINPLSVSSAGRGALAVDVRVRAV